MTSTPILIQGYRTIETQLTNSYQAAPGCIVIAQAGANGSRVHSISASQDGTIATAITLYRGKALCTNVGGNLAIVKGTNDTITDSSNSFITDGWATNNRFAIIGTTDNLKNQIVAHATTVAAGTLTMTGTPTGATAATPAATMALVKANLLWATTMVSGAGNTAAVPAVNMLNPFDMPSLFPQPDTFLMLDPLDYLIVTVGTIIAVNTSLDFSVELGDY